MKKSLILFTVLLIATISFGQQTGSVPKDEYLRKSKKQKTIAWIMLGGGTAVGFIGLTQINLAGSDGDINNTPGTILFFTGVVSSIASIPLFIASKKNKRMAMSLSSKPELIPVLPGNNQLQKSQTTVYLKISI